MTSLRAAKFDSRRAARSGAPANGARILRFKTAILVLIRVDLVRFRVPLPDPQPCSWRGRIGRADFWVSYPQSNVFRLSRSCPEPPGAATLGMINMPGGAFLRQPPKQNETHSDNDRVGPGAKFNSRGAARSGGLSKLNASFGV
jgi:hypothetical protein